jgi:hypothetical protein
MIGRRGFLAALLSAPVTGKAAVKEIDMIGFGGLPGAMVEAEPPEPFPDNGASPLYSQFDRARRKLGVKHQAVEAQVSHMPPKIQVMKSWSPAMREHVYRKHLEAIEEERHSMWSCDASEGLMRQIIKKAFG